MPRQLRGTINLDVQDSVEDRGAFFSVRAPASRSATTVATAAAPTTPHRFDFTNGEIIQVVVDGGDGTFADSETLLAALMARDQTYSARTLISADA